MNATGILETAASIQGKKGLPLWAYIAVGAAAGVAIAAVLLWKKRGERQKPAGSLPTLEALLQRQIVCQTLTADRFTAWADECIQKHPGKELVFFIGRIKSNTLPMFTASRAIPPRMDSGNYMFIESVDNASKFPVDVAVVNCTQLDDVLSEYLKDRDYRLITTH